MKIKAIVEGSTLKLNTPIKFKTNEFEINIADEYLQREEKMAGIEFLDSIWETIGDFPEGNMNWKEEWQKYLEDKHG
ncbi:hypothetical protein SCALIN_C28_0087 [Candidatus Scalindua japonica]|uniref:Uncharacterized protein n=1 Tax=Candidatus Scalindua japonica TaxID=1284222 RepID=A0A286U191_9BACT|nr:hypothetical protein [Candidatus Scalindua japonica]GAX61885.1 hypothetical protein SCALIN_C28_0087 [Candidatus Scalindua japonica]